MIYYTNSEPEKNKPFPSFFQKAEGGLGEAAKKLKGNGFAFFGRWSEERQRGVRRITTRPNAYAEGQSHHTLRALQSLSFLEMGSSEGQYFCTAIEN